MPSLFSSVSLLFLFSLLALAAGQVDDLTVTTAYGPVTGYLSASGNARVWKGVPFAAPPVGNLRWTAPRAPANWTTPIMANVSGSPCTQSATASSSEDCLYLNIFVPAGHSSSATPLPVMVWVYGGAFVSGSNANIDGEFLAGTEMIFVALNYRVGMMGFFAHNGLANNADHSSGVGFYGIQDVRFALQWVQKNIAAFGGDPKLVTLAGESAGAFAICSVMATPKAQGLFSRTIMSSTHCTVDTKEQGLTRGNALTAALGCNATSDADALSCLLAKSKNEIYTAQSQYSYGNLPYQRLPGRFWPSIWGDELTDQPSVIVSKGGGVRTPLLIGNNLNESAAYNCPTMVNIDASTAASYIEQEVASQSKNATAIQDVLKAYNVDSYPTPVAAFNDFQTDFVYRCHSVSAGLAFAKSNKNVYMYSLYHAPAFGMASKTADQVACLGCPHGVDLSFMGMTASQLSQLTAAETNLSSIMRNAWVSFARDGTPSLPNGMQWPLYESTNQNYLIYDLVLSTGTQLRKGFCDVLIGAIGGVPMNQPGFYPPPDNNNDQTTGTSGMTRVAVQLMSVFVITLLVVIF